MAYDHCESLKSETAATNKGMPLSVEKQAAAAPRSREFSPAANSAVDKHSMGCCCNETCADLQSLIKGQA